MGPVLDEDTRRPELKGGLIDLFKAFLNAFVLFPSFFNGSLSFFKGFFK